MKTLHKGIDISRWQKGLDFAQVKANGYDFIIPRDGWGTNDIDPQFRTFVQQAKTYGLSIPAVFHFIYATNTTEAIQNAQNAIRNVELAELPKTTIIWCDLEYDTVDKAKEKGVDLTGKMQKDLVETFCNYILTQGYPTGVYVNQDYMLRVFGKDFGEQYDLWLSDLEGEAAYKCVFRQIGYGYVNGMQVDEDYYYGEYTAGTAKVSEKKKKEEAITTGKPKSKEYLADAFGVLDRPQGLNYENWAPNNCGLCKNDLSLSGDCWNINPKATVWALYMKDHISKNYTPGKYFYDGGGKISGLPDTTGDVIMNNYCTKTTFRKMVASPKAPCMLLINRSHMGAYLGEFVRDGKTYNVSEFSPNGHLGKKMRSYVDEYGRRWSHKGGTLIGSWNQCGYLTAFLDYSDWDEDTKPTPTPTPTPAPVPSGDIDSTVLALEIYAGKWGNNPGRKASITAKYGLSKYTEAQAIVDKIVRAMSWYKTEIKLADEILQNKWGNNPKRQNDITTKYGAHAYRIAQMFVNDIAGEDPEYTIKDLYVAYNVAEGILCGIYGNGEDRKKKIRATFGETVRKLAQDMVDAVLG